MDLRDTLYSYSRRGTNFTGKIAWKNMSVSEMSEIHFKTQNVRIP